MSSTARASQLGTARVSLLLSPPLPKLGHWVNVASVGFLQLLHVNYRCWEWSSLQLWYCDAHLLFVLCIQWLGFLQRYEFPRILQPLSLEFWVKLLRWGSKIIRGTPARKMLLPCYQPTRTSSLHSMCGIFMMWSRGGGRGRCFAFQLCLRISGLNDHNPRDSQSPATRLVRSSGKLHHWWMVALSGTISSCDMPCSGLLVLYLIELN